MPWKAADVVDRRTEFVLAAMQSQVSFSDLCKQYGISRKTGYKWKKRFIEQGLDGMGDASRCPAGSPTRLEEDTVCRIVKLKQAHPSWGPRKIRVVFGRSFPEAELPSESSFKRVLDKAGLVKHRRRRRSAESGRISNRVRAERPNQVWTVDFKGWWQTGDRCRFEPLTVRDHFSCYVLCARALDNCRGETVRSAFARLFAQRGLPDVIRSDNGAPFASVKAPWGLSRLSAWWLALGVDLDRIPPARPDQNGAHERMHRDIAWELESTSAATLREQQAELDAWRVEYNEERPHEAIGMRVPADLYESSPRSYAEGAVELEYPAGYLRRRVRSNGSVKLHNAEVFVSLALCGWDVGLQREAEGRYGLWFCRLRLGEVDLQTRKFTVGEPS